jgi:ureidoglycolate lyase
MSTAIQSLHATPLTAEAFAPYGAVISTAIKKPFAVNGGSSLRHHALASVETGAEGTAILSIFDCQQAVNWPVAVDLLEYHPLGSQAFVPLAGQAFVIVVGPAGPQPDRSALRAFVSDGSQGVSYHCGIWHLPLASFATGPFLVADRAGPGLNLHEAALDGVQVLGSPAQSTR